MRYWLEVARRTASDTQTLQPWRIYVAIGSALVSPFFHRVPGVTIYDLLISSVLSGLGVWGILILGEFAIRFAFMPSAIHREQKQEISRLQVSKGQFRAIIERMNILSHEIMLGRLTAAVVQIRSLDAPPTTMHDFKLYLMDGRNLFASDVGLVKVAAGELAKRHFGFLLLGVRAEDATKLRKQSEWKVSFKDVHDNEYETPIFQYSD